MQPLIWSIRSLIYWFVIPFLFWYSHSGHWELLLVYWGHLFWKLLCFLALWGVSWSDIFLPSLLTPEEAVSSYWRVITEIKTWPPPVFFFLMCPSFWTHSIWIQICVYTHDHPSDSFQSVSTHGFWSLLPRICNFRGEINTVSPAIYHLLVQPRYICITVLGSPTHILIFSRDITLSTMTSIIFF